MNNEQYKKGAIIIEGHIQGLSNLRSLGILGIPVYVIDVTNCISRFSKYCKKFFYCPAYSTDEFVDFLISLAKSEDLKDWVLIPSNDHIVYSLSLHKEKLSKYYKIISPELEIINQIYDKYNLIKLAKSISIPHPATQIFKNGNFDINDLTFPVLIKGKNGLTFYKTFGRKVFKANDIHELNFHFKEIRKVFSVEDIFIQELIPNTGKNKTISFTAFSINGEIKTYWMGCKLREHPIEFGTGTFAESVFVEDCLKHSIPLLRALSYTGVCEIEYLLDPRDNKYKLIEINARTWLWVELARKCNVDFTKYLYEFANNIHSSYPTKYPLGIKWINIYTDIIFSVLAILKGKLSIQKYFNSFKNGDVYIAGYLKGDLIPFFMYFILLFKIIKTRQ